jgi:signal transduction histidine kinase
LKRSSQELRLLLPSTEESSQGLTTGMERVLNQLLEISKIGHEPGKVEKVKLIQLISTIKNAQVARLNPESTTGRPLQFKVRCSDDVFLIVDRSLLEIVLNNLVENALTFSVIKKSKVPVIVEIDVVTRGDMVEISVYDNGLGMSNAVKSKAFNMFYTGHEEAKGHGLGLYAVRKSVVAMRGTVDLMTEEGAFTRVVVTIPRGKQAPRPTTKEVNQSMMVG